MAIASETRQLYVMIQKHSDLLFLVSGLSLAVLYFAFVHHHGQWLIPTDTYYYIALADSFLENRKLLDLTSIPPSPLVTYQNGVSFIYAILKSLGLNNFSSMRLVSTFNFIAWIAASYPFFKLIIYFGITSAWARGILLLGFFSSSFLLNYQFTPGTDGLFNSGAIWLVYLLLSIFSSYDRFFLRTEKSKLFIMIFSSFLISIILVHFSIRILFYLAAFVISVMLCKHENKGKLIVLSTFLTFTTSFSLVFPYLIFDPIMAENNTKMYSFIAFNRAEPLQIMLSDYLSVGSLIYLINGYTLLAILLSFLTYSFIQGYLKNKIEIVFISMSIVIFLGINFLLPNPTMVQAGSRYMISTLPLFCILAMFFKYSRPVAYVLIASFTTVTIINLTTPYPQACISSFWTNLAQKQLSLPENTALFTDRSRYAYVFLNGKNHGSPLSSLSSYYKHIWLAGSAEFINNKLKLLKETNNISIEHVQVLHSDNMSQCLSALVQCDITISGTEGKINASVD